MATDKRQTGRTSRMLAHARELSHQGQAVYVVAASHEHTAILQRMLGDDFPDIKIEAESGLANLDWETLTLRGAWPNTVVLVDHYTIETRFARALEMLTRYDADDEPEPEPEPVRCRNCDNGTWYTECCSGAGGCDCGGREVNMGACRVCNGTGWHLPDANTRANVDSIAGRCFIGSGPASGYWAGR